MEGLLNGKLFRTNPNFPYVNGYFCCKGIPASPGIIFSPPGTFVIHDIMKRRTFLQTSTLGLAGLGLPAGASSLMQQQEGIQAWFRQITDAVQARRKSNLSGCPPQLTNLILETDTFLAGRGFEREINGAFFCADGNTCFYPLLLRRATAGLSDFLVPVFNRQPDGAWKRLAVLTGYQLEALGRAASALAEQPIPPHELLLPAGPSPADGSTYQTLRGAVTTKTQLQYGSAQTEITIYSDQQIIFTENYRSRHTLCSTPIGNA